MKFRVQISAAGLASVLLLSSCTTLNVQQRDGANDLKNPAKKVPGLPFYGKKVVTLQESAWQELRWEVTVAMSIVLPGQAAQPPKTIGVLEVPAPLLQDIVDPLRAAVLGLSSVREDQLSSTVGELEKHLQTARSTLKERESKFRSDVAGYGQLPSGSALQLVANRQIVETVIDASRIFYANSRRPLLGSAKADFALSADQTLTAISAEANSTTLEAVLGALPVTDFASKVVGLNKSTDPDKTDTSTAGAVASVLNSMNPSGASLVQPRQIKNARAGQNLATLVFSVTSLPKARLYTFRKEQALGQPLSPDNMPSGTSLVVTNVVEKSPEASTKGANAFQFSGSVTLPEGKK